MATAKDKKYPWYCTHCGTPLARTHSSPQPKDKPVFCCDGCKTVYRILTTHNLDQYYKIKEGAPLLSPSLPVSIADNRYDYLDSEEHRSKYTFGDDQRQMNFYIEGIHCVACLWLIERIGILVPGIERAHLDMSTSVLTVKLKSEGSFRLLAMTLQQLGYTPHPIESSEDVMQIKRREIHRQLIRVGTAGFCAGNIMLLFISIYSGVEGPLLKIFLWSSFVLMLPVISFCAWPFYRSAFHAARIGQINIDMPVSIALLLGYIASTYHLFIGSVEVYYDSLAIFVFLLLSTRYFLKSLHQKFSGGAHFSEFLMPRYVYRWDETQQEFIDFALDKVKLGDRLQIREGDVVPADGIVTDGSGFVDVHMLTGESHPVHVGIDSEVFAGTVNQTGTFTIKVGSVGDQTRLATIFRNIEQAQKPKIVALADRIAKWFLLVVMAMAAGIMLYFGQADFEEGLKRALALIIVACPCALALATPLAYTIGLKCSAILGALLKGPEVLERLALVDHAFVDKTGTLTTGGFKVLSWTSTDDSQPYLTEAYSLESGSRHPIGIAIRQYARSLESDISDVEITEHEEVIGQGVKGRIHDTFCEIRAMENGSTQQTEHQDIATHVGLYVENDLKVSITLGDEIRQTSYRAVESLQSQLGQITMLTGDGDEVAQQVARQLAIQKCVSRMFPEDKLEVIKDSPKALMIGDGANDAVALASAFVSIAVQGSLEVSFRSSDVYLVKPGIESVPKLIEVSRQTRDTVKRNLTISIIYNSVGITLAVFGLISPLGAAIIMPLSSFTVLLSSYFGIRIKSE